MAEPERTPRAVAPKPLVGASCGGREGSALRTGRISPSLRGVRGAAVSGGWKAQLPRLPP